MLHICHIIIYLINNKKQHIIHMGKIYEETFPLVSIVFFLFHYDLLCATAVTKK